jgi:hypothetical protein
LRETTCTHKPAERLATRVAQLREMLVWADQLAAPEHAQDSRQWQAFLAQRDLAHKILDDQEHPGHGDRTLSTTDPDARCGRHGHMFNGYLIDVLVDADSEIITQINVLPGNGDEAVDAVGLIREEEAAHGNDVKAISIDGAGFHGPMLRELEDPAGLNVDAYVPPPRPRKDGLFAPQEFEEDLERHVVRCPAGQVSREYFHDQQERANTYLFQAAVCRTCPLLTRCMKAAPKRHGRKVRKSDYQAEHDRVRQKAATPQYADIRREHPKVERKLGEVMNYHGGRRARYYGTRKVLVQELMACTATNIKRLVRLLCAPASEFSYGA